MILAKIYIFIILLIVFLGITAKAIQNISLFFDMPVVKASQLLGVLLVFVSLILIWFV